MLTGVYPFTCTNPKLRNISEFAACISDSSLQVHLDIMTKLDKDSKHYKTQNFNLDNLY